MRPVAFFLPVHQNFAAASEVANDASILQSRVVVTAGVRGKTLQERQKERSVFDIIEGSHRRLRTSQQQQVKCRHESSARNWMARV